MATATLPVAAALLTGEQTAAILNVSPATLAVWRCTRRYPGLKYCKIGKCVRYREQDVQAFIRAGAVGTSDEPT